MDPRCRRRGLDRVVLDEAQRIKNWDTKTAQAVVGDALFASSSRARRWRIASSSCTRRWKASTRGRPRWRLLPFHSVTDPRGRVLAYEGLDVLRERLRGFFLRRERRTVLHQLPDRTDNAFWTGMTLAQRRPYREHAGTVATLLQKSPVLGPMEVRACCGADQHAHPLQRLRAVRLGALRAARAERRAGHRGRPAPGRFPKPRSWSTSSRTC
jgi:hypothetical protein